MSSDTKKLIMQESCGGTEGELLRRLNLYGVFGCLMFQFHTHGAAIWGQDSIDERILLSVIIINQSGRFSVFSSSANADMRNEFFASGCCRRIHNGRREAAGIYLTIYDVRRCDLGLAPPSGICRKAGKG